MLQMADNIIKLFVLLFLLLVEYLKGIVVVVWLILLLLGLLWLDRDEFLSVGGGILC